MLKCYVVGAGSLKTHVDQNRGRRGMPERWNAHQYPGQEILGGVGRPTNPRRKCYNATWSALEAVGNPRWKCWEATWSAREAAKSTTVRGGCWHTFKWIAVLTY